LRKFASTRTGKEADAVIAQADERTEHAKKAAEKIDAIKARLAATKSAKADHPAEPAKPATAKRTPEVDVENAFGEADKLRKQADDIETKALLAWFKAVDKTRLPLPNKPDDPRESEKKEYQRVRSYNSRRDNWEEHAALMERDAKKGSPALQRHCEIIKEFYLAEKLINSRGD
jgi:hypothetical protein